MWALALCFLSCFQAVNVALVCLSPFIELQYVSLLMLLINDTRVYPELR